MIRMDWLCSTERTKKMFVKIVHPGGHVELHDRPLLAAEVMRRNPRCCVAYPHVFKQPWAILPPDTTLTLGQKFYVVPIATVRKLQKLSLRYSSSPSPTHQGTASAASGGIKHKQPLPAGHWFACFLTRFNLKQQRGRQDSSPPSSSSLTSPTSTSGSSSPSETKELFGAKRSKATASSPKSHSSYDNWQPSLDSIVEE